jgi:hypothetical protein
MDDQSVQWRLAYLQGIREGLRRAEQQIQAALEADETVGLNQRVLAKMGAKLDDAPRKRTSARNIVGQRLFAMTIQ